MLSRAFNLAFGANSAWGTLRTAFGAHQRLDPIGDLLCRLKKLRDRPVGSVAFGYIVGPRVVDEPLGRGRRQYQLALRNGDESVPKPVKPELGSANLADPGIEAMRVQYVAGAAGR